MYGIKNYKKLQKITDQVHMGMNIYEAIAQELGHLSPEQKEQVRDFVLGSIGRNVPIGQQL